jgi:hypothetical protein
MLSMSVIVSTCPWFLKLPTKESLLFQYSHPCWMATKFRSKLSYKSGSLGQSLLMSSSIWGQKQGFCYRTILMGILMQGALSDEWVGLLFTTAAGNHQHSHSSIQVL